MVVDWDGSIREDGSRIMEDTEGPSSFVVVVDWGSFVEILLVLLWLGSASPSPSSSPTSKGIGDGSTEGGIKVEVVPFDLASSPEFGVKLGLSSSREMVMESPISSPPGGDGGFARTVVAMLAMRWDVTVKDSTGRLFVCNYDLVGFNSRNRSLAR